MLPIQPVIKDICKALTLDATESLKVLSRTLLDELQQSQRMAVLEDAMSNSSSGTHRVQPAGPPSPRASSHLPSTLSVLCEAAQELATVRKESSQPQGEIHLVSPQFATPTATLAEEGYVYHHGTRLSLVILALWISVFITNAVSNRSSL